MFVGTMLAGIAVLHLGVGAWLYREPLREVVRAGVLASIPDFGDRAAAFWFLITGMCLGALALCVRDAEKRGLPLPAPLPAALALLTLTMVVPMPVTGAWLIAPVAWIAQRRLSAASAPRYSAA
jgi:hypothetical protein